MPPLVSACDAASWSHINLVPVQKNVQATFSERLFWTVHVWSGTHGLSVHEMLPWQMPNLGSLTVYGVLCMLFAELFPCHYSLARTEPNITLPEGAILSAVFFSSSEAHIVILNSNSLLRLQLVFSRFCQATISVTNMLAADRVIELKLY